MSCKGKPRLDLFPGLSWCSRNEAAACADWDNVNTNPEKTKKTGTAVTKGHDKTMLSLKRQLHLLCGATTGPLAVLVVQTMLQGSCVKHTQR